MSNQLAHFPLPPFSPETMASPPNTFYDGLGMEDFEFCPMCECWLAREKQWQQHLDTMHTSDEVDAIHEHMSQLGGFLCPICYDRIPDGPSFQDHMDCCHPKPCIKEFATNMATRLPRRRKSKGVRCVVCLEWFTDYGSWNRHLCHHSEVDIKLHLKDLEDASFRTPPLEPHVEGEGDSDDSYEIVHFAEAETGPPQFTSFLDLPIWQEPFPTRNVLWTSPLVY